MTVLDGIFEESGMNNYDEDEQCEYSNSDEDVLNGMDNVNGTSITLQ